MIQNLKIDAFLLGDILAHLLLDDLHHLSFQDMSLPAPSKLAYQIIFI